MCLSAELPGINELNLTNSIVQIAVSWARERLLSPWELSTLTDSSPGNGTHGFSSSALASCELRGCERETRTQIQRSKELEEREIEVVREREGESEREREREREREMRERGTVVCV